MVRSGPWNHIVAFCSRSACTCIVLYCCYCAKTPSIHFELIDCTHSWPSTSTSAPCCDQSPSSRHSALIPCLHRITCTCISACRARQIPHLKLTIFLSFSPILPPPPPPPPHHLLLLTASRRHYRHRPLARSPSVTSSSHVRRRHQHAELTTSLKEIIADCKQLLTMANGQYFEERFGALSDANCRLNPWEVIGLSPSQQNITERGIRHHILRVVTPHVFARGSAGSLTLGTHVPLWQHVNAVKDLFLDISPARLAALRARWVGNTRMTWNPFAAVGSADARRPVTASNQPPCKYSSACRQWSWLMRGMP